MGLLRKRRAATATTGEEPGAATSEPLPRDSERIEDFSDAVFGFAATLLVVSLDVPRSYPELERSLWGFIPFALSFFALVLIWTTHRAFFRRYRLADKPTIALNSILLFVVLFYIYPLKFMTISLIEEVLSRRPWEESTMFSGPQDVNRMFVVYGMGFSAVFACYAMLYRHARRAADRLALDLEQRLEAAMLSRHYWIMAGVGLASSLLAAGDIGIRWGLPGFIYGIIGPLTWAHAAWSQRRRRALVTTPA